MKAKKKPIEVDVWQLDLRDEEPPEWVRNAFENGLLMVPGIKQAGQPFWQIRAIEGIMHAYNGDYLIKGITNELYAVAHDIFEETYEITKD